MDIPDPPISSEEESNTQPTPTLTNVFVQFIQGILRFVLDIFNTISLGFVGFKNTNNIIMNGKDLKV